MKKRPYPMPDPIEMLGTDYDGASKDWYADSDEFHADVEGIQYEHNFEEDEAPDFGEYYDKSIKDGIDDPLRDPSGLLDEER